jgi:hypothetical protein
MSMPTYNPARRIGKARFVAVVDAVRKASYHNPVMLSGGVVAV